MKTLYLITGATGHLGQALVHELQKQKANIRALVLPHEIHNLKEIEIIKGNITNKNSLLPFFEHTLDQHTVLIHAAGIVSISSKDKDLMTHVNVNGTKNIIDLALEYDIDKFIYVSSVHAIKEEPKGIPHTEPDIFYPDEVIGDYAKTKATASNLVLEARQKGLDASIILPSGMVGPYDVGNNHLTRLIINYMKGSLPFGIKGAYDFVDVRDVAHGIISLSQLKEKNEIFILSNQRYTVKEILSHLQTITQKKETKICLPVSFVKIFVPLFEYRAIIKKEKPLFTKYSLYTLNANCLFDHSKATQKLNYKPKEIKQSLKDSIDYLKKYKII